MDLQEITDRAIRPAMALLPAALWTPKAHVEMLAIGLQESRFEHRIQIVNGGGEGPARGFWQFERGGGVKGVCTHPASQHLARHICEQRGVDFTYMVIWATLAHDDVLAAAFARLLLWTDPRSLPELGDADAAWAYYLRNWQPGKPHPETWARLYGQALQFVQEASEWA